MTTTTIRVSASTRDAVNRLRVETGESTDSVLEKALAAYEETLFWRRWQEVYVDGRPELAEDEVMGLWDRASIADSEALNAVEDRETR